MTYYIVTFETSRNGVAWELDTDALVFLTEADAIECAEEYAEAARCRPSGPILRTLDVIEAEPLFGRTPTVEALDWRPMVGAIRAGREADARHNSAPLGCGSYGKV